MTEAPVNEAEARSRLATAIADRNKAEAWLGDVNRKRGDSYGLRSECETTVAELEKSAATAYDNFSRSMVGLETIEQAPQVLAKTELALDLARKRLKTLEASSRLFDEDEETAAFRIRRADADIEIHRRDVLKLAPQVVALRERCMAAWLEYSTLSELLSRVDGLGHPDTATMIIDHAQIDKWRSAIASLKTDASTVLPA